MNKLLLAAALLAGAPGCTTQKTAPPAATASQENQALYNRVMDVHDEVMPKMEDLYNYRKSIKKQLDELPPADAPGRAALAATLRELDSASGAMMVWMREFNPLPDSAGADAGRAYLEAEMKKIESLKTFTLETLEKARTHRAARQ